MNWKRERWFLIIILGAVGGIYGGSAAWNNFTADRPDVVVVPPEHLGGVHAYVTQKEASEKQLISKKLDDGTTLVDLTRNNLAFLYIYRFETTKVEMDKEKLEGKLKTVRRRACKEMELLVTKGLYLEFLYQDVESKPLGRVLINASRCAELREASSSAG